MNCFPVRPPPLTMPDKFNSKFRLNEPQERRLTIVLSRLERALLDLRATILLPPADSSLLKHEDPIDPVLTDALDEIIGDAVRKTGRLARELNLQALRSPVRLAHLAALELLGLDMHDSLPSRGLTNYGAVAPATAELLEKEIPELEARLEKIIRLLSDK
jgi:hypothetical protein